MRLSANRTIKKESEQKDRDDLDAYQSLSLRSSLAHCGGYAVTAVAKEYSFGALGHFVTGALGGAFSGYFLQTLAATVVDSTGEVNRGAVIRLTQWFIQAIAGLVAGAILTMAVGFAKHAIEQHRLGKRLIRCSPRTNLLT